VAVKVLADAAQLASLADETPEGRSVVILAKHQFGLRGRDIHAQDGLGGALSDLAGAEIHPSHPGVGTDEGRVEAFVYGLDGVWSDCAPQGAGIFTRSLRATVDLLRRFYGHVPILAASPHNDGGVIMDSDRCSYGIDASDSDRLVLVLRQGGHAERLL
jgi:hypothetical protein